MKKLLLALLFALGLQAQTPPFLAIIKVDTADDPALLALIPRPIFAGTVTVRYQPIPTGPVTILTIKVPSKDAGVAPIIVRSDVVTYHPEPEWFSVQISIPSDFKVDVANIKVTVASPTDVAPLITLR